MQLDLAKHIAGLIWKKYHLDKLLVGLFFLFYLGLFNTNWLWVAGRLESNLPFVDKVLPTFEVTLTGWKVMGYFAWGQLTLLLLFLWNPLKKFALAVTITLMLAILAHLLQVYQLRDLLPTDSSLVVIETIIHLPLYFFIASQAAFLLLSYAVTKQTTTLL